MKRSAVLLAILIPLALLSSCYMVSSHGGATIHLSFSSAAGRAITGAGGTADKVRVYLYSYASKANPPVYSLWTFPDTGLAYKEAPYPGSVDVDVPKGYLWKVLVSAGTDGANSSFSTEWYGSSDVFPVVGPTSVSITNTTYSPFIDAVDLMGTDLNGVRVVNWAPMNSILYASSANALYAGPAGSDLSQVETMNAVGGTAGLKIQSLANGYVNGALPTPVLFINTDQGIVPYEPGNQTLAFTQYFDLAFSQELTDSSGNRFTILQSGALSDASGIAVFYQRNGGLGGILLNSDAPAPPTSPSASNSWVDFDLASFHMVRNPVYDFAMTTDGTTISVYFATKLGAFRSDSSVMLESSAAGSDDLSRYAAFFFAPNKATIQALAVSGGTIFIGTPTGAFEGILDPLSATNPVSSWSLINATDGDNIVTIAANDSGYVALRSKYNLYVVDPSGQVTAYPFFAGLPGELHSMTWDGNTLYIAGSTGLVSLTVGAS